jgi:hypothetical protein
MESGSENNAKGNNSFDGEFHIGARSGVIKDSRV